MSLFSEVKCGRCDRRYSGVRARCPYCGARRGKRGKHAKDYDNSKGRLLIGLILIAVLIVAAIVIIATSMSKNQADDSKNNDDQQQIEYENNDDNSDNTTDLDGANVGNGDNNDDSNTDGGDKDNTDNKNDDDDTDTPTTGDDDVTPDNDDADSGTNDTVNSVYISNSWSSDPQGDFTANVGDEIQFGYVTDPVLEEADVKWATSDENVFVILQTGKFMAVGEGTATLSLTVNGTTVEISVYVKEN